MPILFPAPERCLLVQAARWFVDNKTMPIPDEAYVRAPGELEANNSELRELFLTLLAEDCDVRGQLFAWFRMYEKGWVGDETKILKSSQPFILLRNARVLMGNAVFPDVRFKANIIETEPWSLDPIARREFLKKSEEFSLDNFWFPTCIFRNVTVDFSKSLI